MRQRFGCIVVIAAGLSGCRTQSPSASPVHPSGGGFSVLMPGSVTESVQIVKTRSGPVPLYIYQSDAGQPGYNYTVAYDRFAGPVADPRFILEAVVRTVTGDNELLLRKDYLQDGHPAVEVRVRINGHVEVARIIIANGHLYQVKMRMPAMDTIPDTGRRYFDSFRIEPLA